MTNDAEKEREHKEIPPMNHERIVNRLNDPCRELPPELTDDRVTDVSTVAADEMVAFAITFDQGRIPFGYWNPTPKGWKIIDARLTHDYPDNTLIGKLFGPREPRMEILVTKSSEQIREDSALTDLRDKNGD